MEKLLTLEINIVKTIDDDKELGVNYLLDCRLGEDTCGLYFDKKYQNNVILPNSNIIKSYMMKYIHKFIKEYEKLDVS